MRHPVIVSRASAAFWVICALLGRTSGEAQSAPTPGALDPSAIVRSATDDNYEVVLKYQAVSSEGAIRATLYLSDYATNAPIDNARITLRTTQPARITATAVQTKPGIYGIDLPSTTPGDYTAVVAIAGPANGEFAFKSLPLGKLATLSSAATKPKGRRGPLAAWGGLLLFVLVALGAVLIVRRGRMRKQLRVGAAALLVAAGGLAIHGESQGHSGHSHAPGAGGAGPRSIPKESQFLLNIRTVVARTEALREQIVAVGHVIPAPGALAAVAAPQTGRFERLGQPLAIGDRVRKGQLLGYLLVIDRLPVRSPIGGLVSEVSVTSGQWVQAGEPLARILNESQMRVEVPLFGENLTKALSSRQATVRLSALPGRSFPARIRGLAPTSSAPEQASGGSQQPTASPIPPVLFDVTNTGGFLRPGMLVEVGIESSIQYQGLAVPQSAVIYQETGPGVFVHTGPEIFEYRPVGITGRYSGRIAVSGELNSGDRIVTEGAYTLVSAPLVSTPSAPNP